MKTIRSHLKSGRVLLRFLDKNFYSDTEGTEVQSKDFGVHLLFNNCQYILSINEVLSHISRF
jgi:hypothetical protein